MCLTNLKNLTFSIPICCPITHPSVFFTIICSKYTQFLNFGSFVSDENPPIAIPNFVKKHPKRQAHIHIYVYQANVRTPLPSASVAWGGHFYSKVVRGRFRGNCPFIVSETGAHPLFLPRQEAWLCVGTKALPFSSWKCCAPPPIENSWICPWVDMMIIHKLLK